MSDRERRLDALEAAVSGIVIAAEMTPLDRAKRVAFALTALTRDGATTEQAGAARQIAELLSAGMRPQSVSTFWL
jgi:hypothetical protein